MSEVFVGDEEIENEYKERFQIGVPKEHGSAIDEDRKISEDVTKTMKRVRDTIWHPKEIDKYKSGSSIDDVMKK